MSGSGWTGVSRNYRTERMGQLQPLRALMGSIGVLVVQHGA